MARPKTDWKVRQAIYRACGRFPAAEPPYTRVKAPEVAKDLELLGVRGIPDVRTIRRYINEFGSMAAVERRQYERVYWPETFEVGGLPWEAAPVVLNLVRERYPERPLVRVAYWYWRVAEATRWLHGMREDGRHSFLLWMAEYLTLADIGVPEQWGPDKLPPDPEGVLRREVEAMILDLPVEEGAEWKVLRRASPWVERYINISQEKPGVRHATEG